MGFKFGIDVILESESTSRSATISVEELDIEIGRDLFTGLVPRGSGTVGDVWFGGLIYELSGRYFRGG